MKPMTVSMDRVFKSVGRQGHLFLKLFPEVSHGDLMCMSVGKSDHLMWQMYRL